MYVLFASPESSTGTNQSDGRIALINDMPCHWTKSNARISQRAPVRFPPLVFTREALKAVNLYQSTANQNSAPPSLNVGLASNTISDLNLNGRWNLLHLTLVNLWADMGKHAESNVV